MKRTDALLYRPIFIRHARMLAQVLGPRLDQKSFEITTRLGRISKQAPTKRTVAPQDALESFHRLRDVEGDAVERDGVRQLRARHKLRHNRLPCGAEYKARARKVRTMVNGLMN